MTASTLRQSYLTVPEAAFVAGVSSRMVQHEIDERIVSSRTCNGRRSISGVDVLYLIAVRQVYRQMAPELRRLVRNAIVHSSEKNEATVRFEAFMLSLSTLEDEVRNGFEALVRVKHSLIETRDDVLGGEPVLRGTRLSARLVADWVRQGASPDELRDEYDLTTEQIEAAVIFDRVTPKRGRPRSQHKAN